MKRLIDFVAAASLLVLCAVPMLLIALAIKLTSRGPVLHVSQRVGRENILFPMPKFRTMRIDTPQLATHLLVDPLQWITPLGLWLRKTSLDELPQLWCVLTGQMSFVGPRPALFNQDDLVAMRTSRGIHLVPPGLTGWAQINGRDSISIAEKVALDEFYLRNRSLRFDLTIVWRTFAKVARGEDVVGVRRTEPAAAACRAA
jgi:O-antigen biosynthesis protein WbqP